MNRLQNSLTIALGLASICHSPALAGDPPLDATLLPGQAFRGSFPFEGDEDRVVIPVLPGAKLTVIAQSVTGSRAKPVQELLLDGALVHVNGAKIVTRSGGRVRILRGVEIDRQGTYEVRITNGGNRLGDYRLSLREKLPRKVVRRLQLQDGQQRSVSFSARASATVTFRLTTPQSGSTTLHLPELRSPDGVPISLDGLSHSSAGGRQLDIGPVDLTSDGLHLLEVTGWGAQRVKVVANLSHATLAASVVVESPGYASVSGTVSLLDGLWLTSTGSGDPASEPDQVAGEILVRVEADADRALISEELGCTLEAETASGWLRLKRNEAPGSARIASPSSRIQVKELVRTARKLEKVRDAQPNYIRSPLGIPSDPLYARQWSLPQAGFEAAWDLEAGDDNQCMAVLDTGIRADHPDLSGRLESGHDFVSDLWNSGDGNGVDSDPTDPFVSAGTHGTHVVGIMAAATGNGLGVAGCTQAGMAMPIRVLGQQGGTDFDISQGILYAAGLPNVSGLLPHRAAQVINMSLGGPNASPILRQAVQDAIAAGVVVVAAAGNSASAAPLYPAAFPEVIAVSATDAADRLTYYSTYGNQIDLAAPGGDNHADLNGDGYPDGILSTVIDVALGADYQRKSGTSMAAPQVAAAAFLLRSQEPNLSVLEVEAYLKAGALDLGPAGFDREFGFGRLDVWRSLTLVAGLGSGAAEPVATPNVLEFSEDGEIVSFAIVNRGGTGPLAVLNVSSEDSWVIPIQTTGQSPCTLQARVSTVGLPQGFQQTRLTVETDAGPLIVPVELSNGTDGGGSLGGNTVFVVAIGSVQGNVVLVQQTSEETGGQFLLDRLPEGSYRIVGVTDLDRDGIGGEEDDFSGEVLDPQTGATELLLRAGSALVGVPLVLSAGRSHTLPGGGNIPLGY